MSGADPTKSSESDSDDDRPMAAAFKVVKDGEVQAMFVRDPESGDSSSPHSATPSSKGRSLAESSEAGPALTGEDMRTKRLAMLSKPSPSPAKVSEGPPKAATPPPPSHKPVEVPKAQTPPPATPSPARKQGPALTPERVMEMTKGEPNCGYLVRYVLLLRSKESDFETENVPSLLTALFHSSVSEEAYTIRHKAPEELWARVDSMETLDDSIVEKFLVAHPQGENESFLIECIGRVRTCMNDLFVKQGFSDTCDVLKRCIRVQYLTTFIPSVLEVGPTRNKAIRDLTHHSDVSAASDMLEEICHHLSSEHEETGYDVVSAIAQYLLQENDHEVQKAGLPLITRFCACLLRLGKSTAGAAVINNLVQNETKQIPNMYGNQIELQSWVRRFFLCPFPEEVEQLLKGVGDYPKVHPQETEQVLGRPRDITSQIVKDIDSLLKDTLLKKGKVGIKTTLDWLKAVLRLQYPRTKIRKDNIRQFEMMQGTKAPHLFALNFAALCLSLAKPVCDKLGEKAVLDYVRSKARKDSFPSWDREVKINREYAGDALEGEYNFATEILFVAADAMHTLVMPAVRASRWAHEAYMRALQALAYNPNEAGNPMVTAMALKWDMLRLQLLNVKFIDKTTSLAVTICSVVERELDKGTAELPESVQALPTFLIEDALDWAVFITHFAPESVKTAEGMPQLVRFVIKACTHPTFLSRHPMLEARVVSLISAMQETHQRDRSFDDAWHASQWAGHRSTTSLFNIVESSPVCGDLPKVLFRVYSASTSEGFDIDKDDDVMAAKERVLPLFVQLIVVDKFKKGLIAGLQKSADEEDDFSRFMHKLVTEATHCLDDALNRLTEVNDIQQMMKDKPQWETLSDREKKQKEEHMETQGRSARGFMSLALKCLQVVQMLLNPNRDDVPPPLPPALRSQPVLRSLAHLVRYFLVQLNGTRGNNLRTLEKPQKYDYDRLGIVQTLCNVVLLLTSTEEFHRVFALHDDYERWVVLHTVEEVKRTQLGGLQLLNKLTSFAEKLQGLNPQTEMAPACEMDEAVWNPPTGKIPEASQEVFEKKFQDMLVEACAMDHADYHFRGEAAAAVVSKSVMTAFKKEYKMFEKNPVYPQACMFMRTDEDRMDSMRLILSGPEGTPYSYGLFVFDVFLPSSYPENPPLVSLKTTGGGTVRFNPNLYENGKVCLSLLGTWHGDGAETKWQPKVSSLSQIALSIQSMILVPDPYFNEPGNEAHQNTTEGAKWSAEYNEGLRLGTLRYAILANIKSPPSGCETLFAEYFKEMAPVILATAHKWTAEASTARRSKFLKVLEQLHEVLGDGEDTETCKWVKAERAQLTGRKRGSDTQGELPRGNPPPPPFQVNPGLGASLMSAISGQPSSGSAPSASAEDEELMRAIQRSLQDM
eukprot:TRINITY_DN14746_c1_g1_i1.p1 TRINITY_DN14746_c1_g1~~TRINITY_DN14746_c1_g1_i1.p1  ORF type:complete len:1393 (+),score=505.03 TRINITY_DN14746_c1_g1_i1:42-4220(+)